MLPKEHGAYGQLGLPLLAALAMGQPELASGCLVIAAFATFFAHESLLVLLGRRGARAKREQRRRALGSGLGWVCVALVGGVTGLWLGGEPVIRAALIPLGLAVAMTPLTLAGREKTLAGEIAAAVTLASSAIPVAVAGALGLELALVAWGVWVIAFTASTAAVRWVIAAHKGRRAHGGLAAAVVNSAAALVLIPQSTIFLSAFPYLLLSWILIARPPRTRHIRRVGWTLIFAGVLTASAAVTLVRGAGD